MQKVIFSLAVIISSFGLFSQRNQSSYHPPLNIPLVLAGNFGELRPNHFHMGLDFKTQGKEGLELYAIEDGYVSRVKVSPFGYGKVVYIDHPNGKTSVYAHCSKFMGKLDSIVKAEQYRTQNFEVELFPSPKDIVLKKGEIFALSGNTGSSTAPHLHFEIRDTKTEHAQNPLVYGIFLPDTKAPEIRKVKAFSINEQGYTVPGKALETMIIKTEQGYAIHGDTLTLDPSFTSSFGGVGLAFDIIDKLDGAENQCGLYGTFLLVDGDTVFGQRTDEISFDHTRYVNSHRDLSSMGSQYHKSFRNISNPLQLYINDNLGVIPIQPGETKSIELKAYDPNGNYSTVSFVLRVLSGSASENYNPSAEYFWYPEEPLHQQTKTWEVIADSFSIYEPYGFNNKNSAHICDANTPLQNRITIRMKLANPKMEVEKYYIAVNTKGNSKKALSTIYKDGWLEAKTNNAGSFSIQTDEAPPVIKPVTTNYNITKPIVKFSITENQTSLADYDLYIDGQWHLLEYESKGSYVFFEVPAEIKGEHIVKIVVKDICGNIAEWEKPMNFN